jgi:ABC-type phosphate/phosphonate transport system substrate-binding protein
MKNYIYLLSLIFISTLFNTNIQAKEKIYTVGIVPQFTVRHLRKIWRPILNELEKETGHKFVFRGSPTIPVFETEFNRGDFDFAYMNPYHVLLANKKQGYIPLVHDTGRQLFGILVVKKDSAIKSIKDLNNKTIAFPAPNALGASLLIRADLANKFKININPTYVKTHSSVYLNVALDQTSAGGGVQKTLNQQPGHIKNSLHVLYKTQKFAPHPFTAHPRVPAKIRDAVKHALLKLGASKEGQVLLKKIPMKKIGEVTMKDYEPIGKLGLEKFYVE